MSYTSKFRAWVFTLNNYTEEDERKIQEQISKRCRYIVYGREIAPETGTPHLQGYVYYECARQRKAVAKMFPRAHVDVANGSASQNYTYCTKEGNFFEFGDRPMEKRDAQHKGGQGNAKRFKLAIELARKGDMDTIRDEDPQMFLLHETRLESLYAPEIVPLDGELQHEWWVGPSGSGKSKLLWELYPNHFAKALNKWWDGYRHQPVVAIEEWAPKNDCTASALKKWADRYPFPGEIKGGCLQKLRPQKVIVLSNYTPQQCFVNSEDLGPILRRFTVINFPEQEQHARFRQIEDVVKVESNELDDLMCEEVLSDLEFPELDLDTLFD